MSKQSDAKGRQQYESRPHVCGNWAHFSSKKQEVHYGIHNPATWVKESELRCVLGGFKVLKTGTCKEWQRMEMAQKKELSP